MFAQQEIKRLEKELRAAKGTKAFDKDFDKDYWKGKTCFNCGGKDHPASHCQNKSNDDDDNASKSSKASMKSVGKQIAKMKKSFAMQHKQLETQIEELEEDNSDISESDDDDDEGSAHLQFATCEGLQFFQEGMEISASASTVDTPGVESQSKNDPAGVIATLVGDDPAGVIDEFMGRNIYPVADFIGPHESPPIGPKEEWRVNEESTHCDNVGMTFEAKLREGQAMGLIFIGFSVVPLWMVVDRAGSDINGFNVRLCQHTAYG